MSTRASLVALLLAAGLLTGCAAASNSTPAGSSNPSLAPASDSADSSGPARPSGDLPELGDGAVGPARYILMPPAGGWGECVMAAPDCPPNHPHAQTLRLEITVPEGWIAGFEGSVIEPEGLGSTDGLDGAGTAIGWSNRAGLHSDPCLPVAHKRPDIPVGPKVEDFVEAVLAHPLLEVSEPVDVEVGGFGGRFLTLTTPSDTSGCDNWRPWEPGIFAQGPGDIWDLWIIDVDGLRMVLLANHFPDTSAENKAELREMIESIRFLP